MMAPIVSTYCFPRGPKAMLTKDNVMKLTNGLFQKVSDHIGAEFPDIEKEYWIVVNDLAKTADTPEAFDVIVMPNLYGYILYDVAVQIAGSANIGEVCSRFKAIYGSASRWPERGQSELAVPRLGHHAQLHGPVGGPYVGGATQSAGGRWLEATGDLQLRPDGLAGRVSGELLLERVLLPLNGA